MYNPKHNRVPASDRQRLFDFIHEYNFGMLISNRRDQNGIGNSENNSNQSNHSEDPLAPIFVSQIPFVLINNTTGKPYQLSTLPSNNNNSSNHSENNSNNNEISDEKEWSLVAHLAYANIHWKSLADQQVIIVFNGPHVSTPKR